MDLLPFLPDEHHIAIAHVATRSALLDHVIEWTIAGILRNDPDKSRHILINKHPNKLPAIMGNLLVADLPDEKPAIDWLIGKITNTRERRNRVIHWVIGKTNQAGKARMVSLRPHREEMSDALDANQIKLIADDLLFLASLTAFWCQIADTQAGRGAQPALPDKSD